MRKAYEIEKDIREAKSERKRIKKEYGKKSYEHREISEEISHLEDELEFTYMHYDEDDSWWYRKQ